MASVPVASLVPFKTRGEMEWVMRAVFDECQLLREAGHAEYAGGANALGNFVRTAELAGIRPEQSLLNHFVKHFDGICAWVRGHRSQREPVRGRIKDAIVYLCLMAGMAECYEAEADAVVRPPS